MRNALHQLLALDWRVMALVGIGAAMRWLADVEERILHRW